jgi:hypothetical protein
MNFTVERHADLTICNFRTPASAAQAMAGNHGGSASPRNVALVGVSGIEEVVSGVIFRPNALDTSMCYCNGEDEAGAAPPAGVTAPASADFGPKFLAKYCTSVSI